VLRFRSLSPDRSALLRGKTTGTARRQDRDPSGTMFVEPLHLNLDVIDPTKTAQMVNKVITLINVEKSRRVAFKIRTTARNMFSTTPNSGLLGPGQEVRVIVTMTRFSLEQYKEVSSNMACSVKFLVRSVPAPDDVTEDLIRGEGASAWWNDRDKHEVMDQIVTCSYVRQATKIESGQPKLRFLRCLEQNKMVGSSKVLAEETLLLLNNTLHRHAFKIRTTARDRYRVEPSSGLIDRGQQFAVKISMVSARGATADKFQVRSCVVEGADVDDATVKKNEFWALPAIRSNM
jgi:hypothetical protein